MRVSLTDAVRVEAASVAGRCDVGLYEAALKQCAGFEPFATPPRPLRRGRRSLSPPARPCSGRDGVVIVGAVGMRQVLERGGFGAAFDFQCFVFLPDQRDHQQVEEREHQQEG
ncbi:MAG: hypothetical protein JWS10_18 [Cypionkella sp.]|nr:hypothetical protein [Cypionkella sp.]